MSISCQQPARPTAPGDPSHGAATRALTIHSHASWDTTPPRPTPSRPMGHARWIGVPRSAVKPTVHQQGSHSATVSHTSRDPSYATWRLAGSRPCPTRGMALPRYTRDIRPRPSVFPHLDVSSASSTSWSPHAARACRIRGPSTHKLGAYPARLCTEGDPGRELERVRLHQVPDPLGQGLEMPPRHAVLLWAERRPPRLRETRRAFHVRPSWETGCPTERIHRSKEAWRAPRTFVNQPDILPQ